MPTKPLLINLPVFRLKRLRSEEEAELDENDLIGRIKRVKVSEGVPCNLPPFRLHGLPGGARLDQDALINRMKRVKVSEGVPCNLPPFRLHGLPEDARLDQDGLIGRIKTAKVSKGVEYMDGKLATPRVTNVAAQDSQARTGRDHTGLGGTSIVGKPMSTRHEEPQKPEACPRPVPALTIRAPPTIVDEWFWPELLYPFKPCGVRIFNLPDHSPDAALREAERILGKVPDLPIVRNGQMISVHRSVFEIVPGNMGDDLHIPVSNAVIQVKPSCVLSAPYVDHLVIGALRRTLSKAGLECRYNGSEGNDRCTIATFTLDTTKIPCPTEPDQLKRWTKRYLVDLLGKEGSRVTSTWSVAKKNNGKGGSYVQGSFGLRSPHVLDKLVNNPQFVLNTHTNPQVDIKYRAADRYIAPTYYTTIAVWLGDAPETAIELNVRTSLQKEVGEFLDKMIAKWKSEFPQHTNEYIIRTNITKCERWFTADPSSPLLADYICDHRSPTEFHFDFVYHMNTDGERFSVRVGHRTTREKDRAFRNRWDKYTQWNKYL